MSEAPYPRSGEADAFRQLELDLRATAADPARHPRTARLQAAGAPQQAKKLVEEAAELAIEAVRADREAAILEAADLLYHLAVLLGGMGIGLDDVGRELDRRRGVMGIAAKQPKRMPADPSPPG